MPQPDMNQIMAQAQQMQQKLQEAQAEIVASTVEGTAGNGLVKVSISGAGEVQSLNIDLKSFISDAVSRGVLTNSMYLHDIFAGFEIWSGGVGLQGNHFTVGVK